MLLDSKTHCCQDAVMPNLARLWCPVVWSNTSIDDALINVYNQLTLNKGENPP